MFLFYIYIRIFDNLTIVLGKDTDLRDTKNSKMTSQCSGQFQVLYTWLSNPSQHTVCHFNMIHFPGLLSTYNIQ